MVDREDDVHFTHAALASHDPAAGRIVVHPTSPPAAGRCGRTSSWLWAPGTDPSATSEEEEHAVHTALQHARPCQLAILRAHRINSGMWPELIHLHRTTRADLVLVHHAELPDYLTHLLRHCDHRIIDTLAGMQKLHPPTSADAQP